MNYQKIYDQLIEKRRQQPLIKKSRKDKDYQYCEKHHIIPRCFGGDDSKDNLVNLTAREHYIAHVLISRICMKLYGKDSIEFEKAICTVLLFKGGKNNITLCERYKVIRFNSRIFQKVREEFTAIASKRAKKYVGSNNGMYGKTHTKESRDKIRQTRKKNECGVGSKNSMYGRPCYYNMSSAEKEQWKTNIRNNFKKNHFKHMYHSITYENVMVPLSKVNEYISKGYVLGQFNKHRRSTKGMIIICKQNDNSKRIWIRPEQLQEYLSNGYISWKNRNNNV